MKVASRFLLLVAGCLAVTAGFFAGKGWALLAIAIASGAAAAVAGVLRGRYLTQISQDGGYLGRKVSLVPGVLLMGAAVFQGATGSIVLAAVPMGAALLVLFLGMPTNSGKKGAPRKPE
ncbi:hypothetical protein GCM10009801_57690 [Streptomyces albiaxialis]|uniref:Integral membrane protein n=1 Tax=Streptomyces albiaxialis TaxID=329523 RepID=A0ABN2WHA8_9ACTN